MIIKFFIEITLKIVSNSHKNIKVVTYVTDFQTVLLTMVTAQEVQAKINTGIIIILHHDTNPSMAATTEINWRLRNVERN